ncbi:hypothetical protein [Methylobacterium sp. A54F]
MASRLAASIIVRLTDQASKPATQIAKNLRQIETAAKRLNGLGGKLEFKGGTRNLDAMAKSARKLTRELQAAAKASIAIRAPSGFKSPFGGMRKDVAALVRDMERLRRASRRLGGRGGRYPPGDDCRPRRGRRYSGDHEAASALGVGAAYRAGRGGLRVAQMAGRVGANMARETSRDNLAGLTKEQSATLEKRALSLSGQYPSVGQNTLHEMLRDTSMSMGSVEKAMQNADALGKMATVVQSLKGPEKAIDQVRQFYAGLDVLGKNVDPKQIERLSNAYTKAMGVEGAELNMGNVLTMAKQAKSGGAALNDRFLMSTVPALMQDLGAPQTGTALSSMVGQIIGGRGTKKSAAFQQSLGMRDKHGRMSERDKALITEDPFQYTVKRLIPLLEKKGIDVNDETKVVEMMSKAFSNSRVADLFTKMITQRSQYERKAEQYDRAPGLAAADTLRRQDPYVAAEGAKQQALNTLGQAAAPYVPAVTDALNKAADALSSTAQTLGDNPDLAKVAAPVAATIAGTIASYLTGKGLLAAAGKSNGLFSGIARLGGHALVGMGTAGMTGLPLSGGAAAGAAMQESDALNEGLLTNALLGRKTAMRRLLEEQEAIQARLRQQDSAASILRGQGSFTRMRAGTLGGAGGPVSTPYTTSRGTFGDFLFGPARGSADLPGFGAGTKTMPTGGASQIEEATRALAAYKAELAGIEQQLTGLKASGEAAFRPETLGLEDRKGQLESMISETQRKLQELSGTTATPKVELAGLDSLTTGLGTAKGGITELGGMTAHPSFDTGSLDAFIGKLGTARSMMRELKAEASSMPSPGGSSSAVRRAITSLDRSKQTAMAYNPVSAG